MLTKTDMLTNTDIAELTALRRALHKRPELSGEEQETAAYIAAELAKWRPDQMIQNLGGFGVAAVFDGAADGPTILFRAELDGLPIEERSGADWSSEISGKGHLCGHDGHMTILLGLARLLSRQRPQSGRVVLMFQPAEEDGSGAKAVVSDPAFAAIAPDWAFAIHNEPGLPFGYVGIKSGVMNCASRGLKITLQGRTSHAAEPELANSPVAMLPDLLSALQALGTGGAITDDFTLSTITHITVGEPSFGITPGTAEIWLTLRASRDDRIDQLQRQAEAIAAKLAQGAAPEKTGAAAIEVSFATDDDFAASVNDEAAVQLAQNAMDALSIAYGAQGVPMRASEDFGAFGWSAKAAMLCLGPGERHPALHQPDYDFADDLIPIGTRIFARIASDLLG